MRRNMKGGTGAAGKSFGRICLAALALAILAGVPSCTNETADESEPAATEKVQAAQKKQGGSPRPQTAEEARAEALAKAEKLAEQIPAGEKLSIDDAPSGSIMLCSGDIVKAEYLSSCGIQGLEAIGIVFFRIKEHKMLVGMDAFCAQEHSYGWGVQDESREYDFKALRSIFFAPSRSYNSFSLVAAGTKQFNHGNNSILLNSVKRGEEQHNVYMDYIDSYALTHPCKLDTLAWGAPTVYESYAMHTCREEIDKALDALIAYYRKMGDKRADAMKQMGGPISDKSYVLTSSTGADKSNADNASGIWAFKGMDEGGETRGEDSCFLLKTPDKQEVLSYQYTAKNYAGTHSYQMEFILVRPGKDGFAAMAVAPLNF